MNPESKKKEAPQPEAKGTTATIVDLLNKAGGPAKDTVKAFLTQALNNGIMPKHALQLGDDTMEAIYSQAYTLYNQGRYKDASYIFRLLMMLDYVTPKYTMGFAACLHRLKDYRAAASIYLLCGTLDTSDPLPHYHAADCYIQLNYPMMALFSLAVAIKAAGTQPEYAVIKERATLMHSALEERIKTEIKDIKESKAPEGK